MEYKLELKFSPVLDDNWTKRLCLSIHVPQRTITSLSEHRRQADEAMRIMVVGACLPAGLQASQH